jgi:hypothetical protein
MSEGKVKYRPDNLTNDHFVTLYAIYKMCVFSSGRFDGSVMDGAGRNVKMMYDLIDAGLVTLEEGHVWLSPLGWHLAHSVAKHRAHMFRAAIPIKTRQAIAEKGYTPTSALLSYPEWMPFSQTPVEAGVYVVKRAVYHTNRFYNDEFWRFVGPYWIDNEANMQDPKHQHPDNRWLSVKINQQGDRL